MFNEPEGIVVTFEEPRKWTDSDLAAILGRQVVLRLIDNELTPEQAFHQARLAGSYGRRALDERDRLAAQRREAFEVVRPQREPMSVLDALDALNSFDGRR